MEYNKISFEDYRDSISNVIAGESCPVKYTLGILQGKWNFRVLFELSKADGIRFGTLKRLIPDVTNTMLTATLKRLEEVGLVERIQYNEIPLRVEYSLSEKGKELYPIFIEMTNWGNKYKNIQE